MNTRQLLTIDGKRAVRFRDEWKETLRLLIDNYPTINRLDNRLRSKTNADYKKRVNRVRCL